MACCNAELGKLRAHKRQELLEAPAKELEEVRAMVERGDLRGAGKLRVRAGRVVNKYEVAKHFDLTIEDARFEDSSARGASRRSLRRRRSRAST